MKELANIDRRYLEVRNTVEGKLSGSYHFRRTYVFDHENRRFERRRPIICRQ